MKIDELLEINPKDLWEIEKFQRELALFECISDSLQFHLENNKIYQYLWRKSHITPDPEQIEEKSLKWIPYITTSMYKRFGGQAKNLLLVPQKEIVLWSLSRGTKRDTSLVGRNTVTLKRIYTLLSHLFKTFIGPNKPEWVLLLQPPIFSTYPHQAVRNTIKKIINQQPLEEQEKKMIPLKAPHLYFLFESYLLLLNIPITYGISIKNPSAKKPLERFGIDLKNLTKFFESEQAFSSPGLILGEPSLIELVLSKIAQSADSQIPFHKDSFLITLGGWRDLKGKPLDKQKFREHITDMTMLKEENIRDVYTFTETDAVFMECSSHRFHVLPYFTLLIRDVESLETVENDTMGLINIFNPIAHSYAGISVIQDDVGVLRKNIKCECGITSDILELK